jgi:hypothetical protein
MISQIFLALENCSYVGEFTTNWKPEIVGFMAYI